MAGTRGCELTSGSGWTILGRWRIPSLDEERREGRRLLALSARPRLCSVRLWLHPSLGGGRAPDSALDRVRRMAAGAAGRMETSASFMGALLSVWLADPDGLVDDVERPFGLRLRMGNVHPDRAARRPSAGIGGGQCIARNHVAADGDLWRVFCGG